MTRAGALLACIAAASICKLLLQPHIGYFDSKLKSSARSQTTQFNDATIQALQDTLAAAKQFGPYVTFDEASTTVYHQIMQSGIIDETVPEKDSITIVSGLWDFRAMDPSAESVYGQTFDDFVERLITGVGSLRTASGKPIPKILFVDETVLERVQFLEDAPGSNVKFVLLTLDQMKGYMGRAFDDMVATQQSRDWSSQAGWLGSSPQKLVPSFNLVGFSKIFLLREAARSNPFNTQSFLWIDGRSDCISGAALLNTEIFTSHFDRFLGTYFSYDVTGEVHGFAHDPFIAFAKAPAATTRFKIIKGAILGGKRGHIEAVALLIDLLMRYSLMQRAMGVEESLYAILTYRFPRLFHLFSNDNACAESTNYDRRCDNFMNPSGHCAIMSWAMTGPRFRHPPERQFS